jgi:hypothetical protein
VSAPRSPDIRPAGSRASRFKLTSVGFRSCPESARWCWRMGRAAARPQARRAIGITRPTRLPPLKPDRCLDVRATLPASVSGRGRGRFLDEQNGTDKPSTESRRMATGRPSERSHRLVPFKTARLQAFLWARRVSNLRPLVCEPLGSTPSYSPWRPIFPGASAASSGCGSAGV